MTQIRQIKYIQDFWHKTFIQKQQNIYSFKCTLNVLQERSPISHKTSLSKFKKTDIISSIFLNDKKRLEINYKKETTKTHKHVEVKQHATKQPMGHWKYKKKKIKKSGDKWKWKYNDPKSMISRKAVLREKLIAIQTLQQQIKSQNKPSHLTPKGIRNKESTC